MTYRVGYGKPRKISVFLLLTRLVTTALAWGTETVVFSLIWSNVILAFVVASAIAVVTVASWVTPLLRTQGDV